MKILFTKLLLVLTLWAEAAAPTLPSTNPWFNAIDGAFFNLGWSAGNGARRIMVCKVGSSPTFIPQNGVDYDANTTFGLGPQVAPGEYIVYDHFSSSFFLTGLTPATQYFFRVFEYNGTGAATEYLTSSFLAWSGTTSGTPTSQTSSANFTNITTNSVTVSWASGNGLRRLIVVRESTTAPVDPVVGQPYSTSLTYGNGATTGAGNFTVYNSSGTSTTVTNLTQGKQYTFSFYEFNGSSQPQYLLPAYSTNVTTRSVPTIASTGVSITQADGKALSLAWTNGNGQRRIIIARKNLDVTSTPVNGSSYTANAAFGSGQQLSVGEFVVYNDNFHATTVTGLDPSSTYFFKIFEYDGTGSTTAYLTAAFGSVNGATVSTPTVQSLPLPATNITSTSLRLTLTPGNGRARLIIGRKDAAVNVSPTDFTTYNANSNFGQGQDLGNGNFVLAVTTESLLNVNGLQAAATYHFAMFELNGFNQPLYLAPAAVTSAMTIGALPVKLISWEAVPANNKIKLQWKTSSEINASHFIIERSADGIQYSPIATVNASGNTQGDVTYNTEDNSPLNGRSYYRLKMVDLDGTFEYSVIRQVIFATQAQAKILGNPARDVLQVITSSTTNNASNSWQIINVGGQVVKKGVLTPGRMEINITGFKPGNYWLRMQVMGEIQTLGFVKL